MQGPDEAAAPEIWWIRGEGGDVIPMQLPLGEGIPARLRTGALMRVNEDGSPYTGGQPVPGPPASLAEYMGVRAEAQAEDDRPRDLPMPARTDRKDAWVAYAWSTGRITEAAAEDLTKAELVDRFGGS